MPGKPKHYTPEFKEQAVKKVAGSSPPRTITGVARELNINDTTLGFWVKAYRKKLAGQSLPADMPDGERVRELERRVRETRNGKQLFEKSGRLLREGAPVSEKYEFIDAEYAVSPAEGDAPAVVQMCEWLGVSTSGFYDWRKRPESDTARRREILKIKIKALFEANNSEYGYRRIHAALVRGGETADDETVRRLMRELGLEPCQPRPWRHSLTEQDGQAGPIPDLVNRDFTADKPGQKMVGDITYVDTWEGWVYLATVIDCATRKVIGWAIDDNYKTPLISRAIQMAARNLDLPEGAVFHSDRGSNYISAEFGKVLKELGISRSVGRTGICYDNALSESVNGTLKNELVYRTVYATRKAAMNDIARWIELRYNRTRLHSTLGYRTPQEVLDEYLNGQEAA